MRTANILIIGMRALANEVAKNLVLAGIGSLTILDSEDVVEDDLGAQFFISEEDVGINVSGLSRIAHSMRTNDDPYSRASDDRREPELPLRISRN
jgi:molybdopterin/thiamine biosynthesis adenylyltransferase